MKLLKVPFTGKYIFKLMQSRKTSGPTNHARKQSCQKEGGSPALGSGFSVARMCCLFPIKNLQMYFYEKHVSGLKKTTTTTTLFSVSSKYIVMISY